MNWLRRGQWVPLLPPASRGVAVGVIPLVLILTGVDYLLPGITEDGLSVVEKAAPIELWGILCLISGLLMLTGFRWRWPRPVIIGAHLGAATFITLAVGQFVAITAHPWWDGLRSPVITAAVGIACWGMALGYATQTRGGGNELG